MRRGKWKYDGRVRKGVIIVAINYDHYYELETAAGFDMSNERPELNEDGEMFLIKWTDDEFGGTDSVTAGTRDLDSTIEAAESVVSQKIQWID